MSAGWWFGGVVVVAALLLVLAVLLRPRSEVRRTGGPWPGLSGLMPGDEISRQHLAHAWNLGRRAPDSATNPYGQPADSVLWLLDVLVDPEADMRCRFGNALAAAIQSRDWLTPRGEMEAALAEVLTKLGFDPHRLPNVAGVCEHEEVAP